MTLNRGCLRRWHNRTDVLKRAWRRKPSNLRRGDALAWKRYLKQMLWTAEVDPVQKMRFCWSFTLIEQGALNWVLLKPEGQSAQEALRSRAPKARRVKAGWAWDWAHRATSSLSKWFEVLELPWAEQVVAAACCTSHHSWRISKVYEGRLMLSRWTQSLRLRTSNLKYGCENKIWDEGCENESEGCKN